MDKKQIRQAKQKLAKALDLVLEVGIQLDTDSSKQAKTFSHLHEAQMRISSATKVLETAFVSEKEATIAKATKAAKKIMDAPFGNNRDVVRLARKFLKDPSEDLALHLLTAVNHYAAIERDK